ncbi:MAG TPA: adenylosuccinate lyase [Halanaerobiaceae bacterium]|nr:adenylosuccinate lyase [Bacillota bacterium]HHU91905.1 adenylosuccinate lyase [Halanaerobiaceae bacterium]HOA40806.1 adenylosuccinate lyase [Halanaerobiales bacterium]HPZ63013.1 adenylosuccinate lyase [Halanaerobiales bacterium]HQD04179.1 adenylosuccinate lyase [Halanaerobiales bacterium]
MITRYSLPEMVEIWSEENKYRIWLDIELAACRAWSRLGKIPETELKKIEENVRLDIERIREIEQVTRHDILAFVEAINESLGDESKYIHMGLTSNDVKDTALAIQMKEALELILKDLHRLKGKLAQEALLHKDTIMIGRTHGVHGEPITWGLKLLIWYEEIKRHIERMEDLRKVVSVGIISGAVGTYASIDPRVEELVCQELGLEAAPVTNQILQRDRHADFVCTLALIAASLEKFATEIRNLQRTDILEVEEGFRKGQKGSSAMPHKKNPIICERISGLARVIRGNVIPALENISLWHERDLTHSSVERVILPDSSILVHYMLNQFIMVLDELVVNKDRMEENLARTHGLIFSQKVMLALVDKGLSREEAYALAQRNALEAWDSGESYLKLLQEDEEVLALLSKEELERIFDYKVFLKEVDYIYEKLGLHGEEVSQV